MSANGIYLALLIAGGAVYAAATIVLWTGVPRSLCAKRRTGPPQKSLPTVTVIVPARNETANIGSCLAALGCQTYPRDRLEVIVVDDRSDDGTGALVAGLIPMLPVAARLVRIDATPPGWSPKKHALTTAIVQATGGIILTTDADCRPEPGWVAGMVDAFETGSADLVAGYPPFEGRRTFAGKLLALETLSQAFIAMGGIGLGWPITCAGRSFGYRKRVFAEVGGFGEVHTVVSGDDHLLLQRAVGRGYRPAYCAAPRSKVWTDPPESPGKFINQRIRMYSSPRRHPLTVSVPGALVWLFVAATFVGLFALSPAAWIAFGAKAMLDLVSLSIAARRLDEWRLLRVYPLAAILWLPYFLVFPFLGAVGTYRWKGSTGR